MDLTLVNLTETSETRRRDTEAAIGDEMRKGFSDYNERFTLELEHLKADTGAFEEGIREQMKIADDSLSSFREQLDQGLEEVRSASEAAMKTEIGRYSLTLADSLKQQQRELEERLKEIAGEIEERNSGINALVDASRRDIEEWQAGFSSQMRDVDAALEDARRRTRAMVSESDERLTLVRSEIEDLREESDSRRAEIFSRTEEQAKALDSAIKDADRHIKEFVTQTKLFDRADELKVELERRIEDLRGDLDRLDQRRSEAAQLEGQFVKIKRLEDEVNLKMTRFLSEKHRIEQMEADFNRLLLISKAVEEKLVQVSSSDDTLQAVQVQIRRFDDALTAVEEKYQRVEKKGQALDETTDSIDRNFRALQESEDSLRRFNEDLQRLTGEMETLHDSVEDLARENEKARETAEKLAYLDSSLSAIEERITAMNKAREWVARTETRLEELNRDAQEQVKLMGAVLKGGRSGGDGKAASEKGALPIGDRETVVKLARQGWTVDQIARSMKISKGEVELILEIGSQD
jgi:chromosome segregation ATPase